MRTMFFSCFLALGIALGIWCYLGPNESPASRNPPAAKTQATSQDAIGQPRARPASSKAGIALRSTSILAAAKKPPHAGETANAPEKTPSNETQGVRASAREEAAVHPKSAAELFSPFVEDDPSLVFPPSTVQYHSALRSEPADPDWGPQTAAGLRNFIASQYGDRFEIPVLECRRDLCELQVAGRIGGDSAADMDELQRMMHLMKQSQLWSSLQLDQETSLLSTSPDGRALWLSFISRL